MSDSYLEHYGVLGMKWGVRRTPEERRTYRKLNRRVGASEKNLKSRSRIAVASKKKVSSAQKKYKKALESPGISSKKKLARIEEATEQVREALKNYEIPKAELARAKRIYKNNEKNLKAHVDSMVSKYGEEAVTKFRTKDMKTGFEWKGPLKLGRVYSESVVNTGLTFANFPVFGTMWSGSYISGQDNRDRSEILEEIVKKQY